MARLSSSWGSTTSTACWDTETHERKYYGREAMRLDGVLYFILTDHASASPSTSLGSTSTITNDNGSFLVSQGYDAWGAMRYTHGTILTDKLYTGQRLSGDIGLYDYKARWFDPIIGRFLMEDPIIPNQGVMRLERYAYVNNSPIFFIDPSGNRPCDGKNPDDCSSKNLAVFWIEASLDDSLPNVVSQKTKDSYNMIRRELFVENGVEFLSLKGKIDDEAFLNLIAREFASINLNDPHQKDVYYESIEALSNQYYYQNYSRGCKGNCTLSEQLTWMEDIQFLRDVSKNNRISDLFDGWLDRRDYVRLAMNPNYKYGDYRASWSWGNYDPGSKMATWISKNDTSHFIVAVPGMRYVILSSGQNLNCNNIGCKACEISEDPNNCQYSNLWWEPIP